MDWCLTSIETIRSGGGVGYGRGWGKREIIYLSLQYHHQNDCCIKMGSDESHFNVSLIVRGKVTKTVSTNDNLSGEKGEAETEWSRGPSAYQPNALPLSQTGSLSVNEPNNNL